MYLMDSYAEQIVKKADDGKDSMMRMACLAGGVMTGIILVFIGNILKFSIIGILLGIGALYGGFYLSGNYDVEYEYTVVNGDLDIDKILSKKKRQKMFEVSAKTFERFGKYTDDTEDDRSDVVTVSAIGDNKDLDIYYADFNDEKYGDCRLLFTPSEKILREIKPYLRGTLRLVLSDIPDVEEEKY